jgi:type IV secretion system protein VirD4
VFKHLSASGGGVTAKRPLQRGDAMSMPTESNDWGVIDFRYADAMWHADWMRIGENARTYNARGFSSKRRVDLVISARMFVARMKWYLRVIGRERLWTLVNPLKVPFTKLLLIALMVGVARIVPLLLAESHDWGKTLTIALFVAIVYAVLIIQLIFVRDASAALREARQGLIAGIRAWLGRWRWYGIWGEVRIKFRREKWVVDLSKSDRSSWGIGGGIRTAAETVERGKALMIGLWFIFAGIVLMWISVPCLMRALTDKSAASFDWFWPVFGIVTGAYLLCARGLGPAQSAFSLSRLSTDTHGKARWATLKELRQAGLAPRTNGVYIGRFLDDTGAAADTVGYPGPLHLITIGPNNSGKGTGLIIPNLSDLQRSIFIIDPKGEAAAVTARKRARFGPVKIINPFNLLADKLPYLKSGGFNPLAALDPRHDNFTDDCVAIAQALVKEEVGGNAAFFSGSAQDLIAALVMYEKIERGHKANLGNVRKMLTEPYGQDAEGNAVGLAHTIGEMTESKYDPLRSKAGRFRVGGKSVLDIISTAANETRLLDSPALQRDLSGEAINWDSMKEEITTVYLILPSDRLETHANFLRLVVTSALRTLLRSPPSATLPPVLFMLDEFAQLGYLPPIENAMGIARGFGVQLWPFLQDLNQLHALYKDRWQTFISARGVLTAFAPQDMFTAEYLSKLCGNKTVIVESENVRPDSGLPGGGRGPQGVPLIRPEELMGMPAGQMLCFAAPVKNPFFTTVPGYWETSFAHGLDPNPYYQG